MYHELEPYRSYFPFLKSGKIYMNHAAISPMSAMVMDKLQQFISIRSEGAIDDFKLFMQEGEHVKQMLGTLLNTTSDRIAFSDNTSNALNIFAQGLRLQAGDEVILNDVEFPSNVYPFLNLQSDGVKIVYAKSNNGVVAAEDIISCITPATKVVSVSFVQFLSGYRINLKTLTDYCKPRGIIVCVDAIQGLGAINLDLKETPVDFIAAGCQKWLMGTMGLAFIYVSKELQEMMQPRYVGWLSVKNAWNLLNFDLSLKSDASAFQSGTLNVMGIFALSGALELFEKTGHALREEVVLENTGYFINHLLEIGFRPFMASYPKESQSGIITFHPDNGMEIFTHLENANIVCSLREGMIRFAPHFYNTRAEIDIVIDELLKLQ